MKPQVFQRHSSGGLVLVVLLLLVCAAPASGQTTAFTYQGRLTDGGTPANGNYDFEFDLYDTPDTGAGTQIGPFQSLSSVPVTDGIFSVTLDFGANSFPGADRFLQIIVRRTADTGIRTLLSPRQQLTSTPYAVRSVSAMSADSATNATQLGGVEAGQYVLTSDTRLSDSRPPSPGSANYIQNTTTAQLSSNFSISGAGKADTFDAATQFNLAGARVLSNAGTNNFFAGQGAGQANTTGDSNSFFGASAGLTNADGRQNSFFGRNAGQANSSGSFNAFFGSGSGLTNADGNNNAFFGYTSGRNNASGSNDAFFGNAAGFANINGSNNSFFGASAGNQNSSGVSNNFFGAGAGAANTSGFANTFLGTSTGSQNTTGSGNTLIGNGADLGSGNLFNASAVGAQALVSQPNSLVLGSINGVNNATADTNIGIGTTSPAKRLHVVGDGLFTGDLTVNGTLNATFGPGNPNYIQNSTNFQSSANFNIGGNGTVNGALSGGTVNSTFQYNLAGVRVLANPGTNNFFAGQGTGNALTTGSANAFFGPLAGALNTSGQQNSFFGSQSGNQNSTGTGNSFFGAQAGKLNSGGTLNSFFGGNAGFNNTTGTDNSYFGVSTGFFNTTGSFNAMFGNSAGQNNTTSFNSFFGYGSGQNTTSGDSNAFFGQNTGNLNFTGKQNAFFGTQAGAGSNGNDNAFVGTAAGGHNQIGSGNTALGGFADMATGALQNTTAIGARAFVSANNSLVLGGISGVNGCTVANNCADTNVGIGTTAPTAKLHVVGDELVTGNLTVNGSVNASFGPGNANYIQNTTTQQAASNFNISGDGTAGGTLNGNVVNATGQYNIGGVRVISNQGTNNFFAGQSAGVNNTGSFNSFFGAAAGGATTTGSDNSFFGENAGKTNTTGVNNTMLGFFADAGSNNLGNATAIGARAQVTQNNSLVLGSISGVNGATADTNVGIGTTAPTTRLHVAGDGLFTGNLTVNGTISGTLPAGSANYLQNTTTQQAATNFNISGNGTAGGTLSSNIVNAATQYDLNGNRFVATSADNTFTGQGAGPLVSPDGQGNGEGNSFFGDHAGALTTNGSFNSFFGKSAGSQNTTSVDNSYFGYFTGGNATGNRNSFFGFNAGGSTTSGSNNVFIGFGAGGNPESGGNVSGSFNTAVGNLALIGAGNLTNATAIGASALVNQSNSLVLGSINGVNSANADTNVGIGTTTPEQRLHVNGNEILSTGSAAGFKFRERNSTSASDDWVWYGGVVGQAHQARLNHAGTDLLSVDQLGTATVTILRLGLVNNTLGGGQQSLCRDNLNFIGDCSSSLRYKTNIAPFSTGLNLIRQLRPISYDWKAGGMHDVGFGAEDVAKINPLFVTYNKEGQVEGVKYDRLSTVFVNAFNEQQTQITQQQQEIERQQRLLKQQQTQIESLQKLICLDHPNADVCTASPR